MLPKAVLLNLVLGDPQTIHIAAVGREGAKMYTV